MVNRNAEMTNFATKGFRSTRRMLFVSFYVIKEPKSCCTFGSVDQCVPIHQRLKFQGNFGYTFMTRMRGKGMLIFCCQIC